MHGIALHCVATGKDRLMSEQGNGLDPVSQSGFTCTVHASCRVYHGRTVEYLMGAAAQDTALSGHDVVPGGVRAHPPTAQWSELGGTCLVRLVRLQDACLCLWMRRVLDSN